MMKSLLMAGALIVSAAPAFAQEYYIVRGENEEDCRIVESRPTENTIIQIGPVAFATREEAERQLTVLCENEDGDQVIIKERD